MNLGDLLNELRANILHDRSNRVAGEDDRLWSDETLVRYIDEAQRRLAREGLVIRDGTTPVVTTLALEAGVDEYRLHPSVVAVVSARQVDASRDLSRIGHTFMNIPSDPSNQPFDINEINIRQPGRPLAFSTDEQTEFSDRGSSGLISMKLLPTPSAEYIKPLRLRVVRLPIHRLDMRNLRAVPEVPEEHHLEMLDWAAYLALRIADVDAGMPQRAMEFRASFEDVLVRARRNAMRKMFAPKGWGFGRNGFSWSR